MLAKIATTVDIVSGGRLVFGIGAGSRPATRWRAASTRHTACPTTDFRHSVEDLANLRRHPAAVDGNRAVRLPRRPHRSHRRVRQPEARPAPVPARPRRRTLGRGAPRGRRARGPMEHRGRRHRRRHPAQRAAGPLLHRLSRDPAAITRSITLHVSYDRRNHPGCDQRSAQRPGLPARHLGLPAQPYPASVARWVADELIAKSL